MIPMRGLPGKPPTARLQEIHRQLSIFRFSQSELGLLRKEIEMQLQELK